MTHLSKILIISFYYSLMGHYASGEPMHCVDATLPPTHPWSGASESLMVKPSDPWVTPAEETQLKETPDYPRTMAYLKRLVDASDQLSLVSIGTSPLGYDIPMVIASNEINPSLESIRNSNKPVLLAQGGIHAGEIDGKDAGLMLLRDMAVNKTQAYLLNGAHFLFIPMLNGDGHERRSTTHRVNQRGPKVMGWRTNSNNLNLNRDFTKLDTPGVRAVVQVMNQYQPDLYIDLHVTDGIDYQYDITFGYTGTHGYSGEIVQWLDQVYTPFVNNSLEQSGHIPGPLMFAVNNKDLQQGLVEFTFGPRFSNGYGDVRHIASILVENHSLKPYKQRVLGTYVLLKASLQRLASDYLTLRAAQKRDQQRFLDPVPLTFKANESPDMISIKGIAYESFQALSSGEQEVKWLGSKKRYDVPYIRINQIDVSVPRPKAYWIGPQWQAVIARIEQHGIAFKRLTAPQSVSITQYKAQDPAWQESAFEGRVRVSAQWQESTVQNSYPKGTVVVNTDQPLGDLAIHLLEPKAPDSLLQWGFFQGMFQRTEYIEGYVLAPMADQMLAHDKELAKRFNQKLKEEPTFANDPQARLRWFYEQTPYYDQEYLIYPVGVER